MLSPLPTRRQALAQFLFVVLTAVVCSGLLCAAALAPAPPVVLPLLVVACIGLPMLAACELPPALAVLRAGRALRRVRGQIHALPEVEHPLGL
jgi:hypothetical protein